MIVLFWSLRGVIEATATVSPDAWLRHLDLLLTSLAPSDRRLEHPPLTPGQIQRGPGRGGPPRRAAGPDLGPV